MLLTASALLLNSACSVALKPKSIIFSHPLFPITTGTPRQISLCPYSPSRETQQVNNFFSSLAMLSTSAAPAAPGAYHADVPINLVSVAPPIIVSAVIFICCSSLRNLVTGTLFQVANRIRGIIVVSPCPPITTAFKSDGLQLSRRLSWYLKRALSSAPPIPMILFLGNPVAVNARYVIVSIGLLMTSKIALGECFK